MSEWAINLDSGKISITDFTPGDWALLNEIRKDIMQIENIKDADQALLMAFIAFMHLRSMTEDSKRTIDDNLH